MPVNITLIGPEDSVKLIESVGREFSSKANILSLLYKAEREVFELVEKSDDKTDVYLFSGPFPYELVQSKIKTLKPMVYVPYSESSVSKCLWHLREDGYPLDSLSFDTVSEDIIKEVYQELGVPFSKMNVLEYGRYNNKLELVKFHEELYGAKETKAAVTCLRSAYDELKETGIPVYRITPTKNIIRDTFRLAVEKGKTNQVLSTQICAQIVRIVDIRKLIQALGSEYELQRLQVQLHEKLIGYCSEVQGAIFNIGSYEYLMFTTRGAVEGITFGFQYSYLFEKVLPKSLNLVVGTGIGRTANEAVNNARLAMEGSIQQGGNCEYITVEKSVKGPIGREINIEYKTDIELEELVKSRNLKMGAATLEKIKSIVNMRRDDTITSRDLAQFLAISERSARRLLTDLSENGLAKAAGEQRGHAKGRNRIVYKITL